MGSRRRSLVSMALAVVAGVVLGSVAAPAVARAASISAYRLYNPYNGAHLITVDRDEYRRLQRAGWQGEGNPFNVQDSGAVPVYRLYNGNNGDHFFTADIEEYRNLERAGWQGEDVKFYGTDSSQGQPVYRLWNSQQRANGGLGSHLWTPAADEYDRLPAQSGGAWRKEDVAWYATPGVKPTNPSFLDASDGQRATFQGTIVREAWPTSKTHMGWSAVFYFLKLDRPISVRYSDPSGATTRTLDCLQLANIEQYGDQANVGLGGIFSDSLQPYVGFPVSVTGTIIDIGNAHCMYPRFDGTSTIQYLS